MILEEYDEEKQRRLDRRDAREQGIEQGKMQLLFSMVQDGELSIEKAAGKVNIPVPDFEKRMEEAGYKSSSVR